MQDAISTTTEVAKVYEIKDTITCEVCGDVMDLTVENDVPVYNCRNAQCGVAQ